MQHYRSYKNLSALRWLLLLFVLLVSCTVKREVRNEINIDTDTLLINRLQAYDEALPAPTATDWLNEHVEKPQSFKTYKTTRPVSPNTSEKIIYLQPIGEFDPEQYNVILYTSQYLQDFFGLKTILLSTLPSTVIPINAKRMRNDQHEQLLTTYILNYLKNHKPKDAIAYMAITEKDLYPADSWNFVFGQANAKKKVGVSSIYRFSTEAINSVNYPLCLNRLIKTSSHEISHVFSMPHCIYATCLMNGSNSLVEADSRPNRLCSNCLKKLQWNLKFNVTNRAIILTEFFNRHKLQSDYKLYIRDLNMLKQDSVDLKKDKKL